MVIHFQQISNIPPFIDLDFFTFEERNQLPLKVGAILLETIIRDVAKLKSQGFIKRLY